MPQIQIRKVSYADTRDAIFKPTNSLYRDKNSITNEINRTFDLCNGCRLCFKFCPTFPTIFKAMDDVDNDVFAIPEKKKEQALDECFQCKLCYNACPYTEGSHHPYAIDFPALMLRAKIARRKFPKIRDLLLGNPDLLGKLAVGPLAFFVNLSMKIYPNRILMHHILGIHKHKFMPRFVGQSFQSWYKSYAKKKDAQNSAFKNQEIDPTEMPKNNHIDGESRNEVVTRKNRRELKQVLLFYTCFVNYNNPEIGKDTVDVLEKNGVDIACPNQNCCGMPALESGNTKLAIKKMKKNIASLLPFVEEGYKILVINPTCSMTLKKEYPLFLQGSKWEAGAEKISAATMDVNEYLFSLHAQEKFKKDFRSTPNKVAYHVPCHLRAQNIGLRSRDLMRLIPDTKLSLATECCGHDGTWAMKKEFFDMSMKVGKKAFTQLKSADAPYVSTDCPLAAIQIQQGMDLSTLPTHPIQILAKAYKSPNEGGFDTAVNRVGIALEEGVRIND